MLGNPPRRGLPKGSWPCLVVVLGALLGLLGCAADAGPELLNVIDVVPRAVDVGDRIEILGTNLPAGEAREALVTFRGELRRPGQAPLADQVIEIDRAQIGGDKVTMLFTEGLQTRFC